jgi:hypothetical protein
MIKIHINHQIKIYRFVKISNFVISKIDGYSLIFLLYNCKITKFRIFAPEKSLHGSSYYILQHFLRGVINRFKNNSLLQISSIVNVMFIQ